jgi:hypothetical protein
VWPARPLYEPQYGEEQKPACGEAQRADEQRGIETTAIFIATKLSPSRIAATTSDSSVPAVLPLILHMPGARATHGPDSKPGSQLRCGLGLEGGHQDRLDESFEGDARCLGCQRESRGLGETGDRLHVDNPGGTFGEDSVHPRVA